MNAATRTDPIATCTTLRRDFVSVQALTYEVTATPHSNAETNPEEPPNLAFGARLTKARVAAAAESQAANIRKLSLFFPEIEFDIEYRSNIAQVIAMLAPRCAKSL